MKNFRNYKAAKYADTEKFVEVEEGIYRTKDPYGHDEVYVTSLTFELEDDNFEGGCSPQDIPQAPFEDLLEEFNVYVTDFYEAENEASEVTCYQEFGSPKLEDIQNLRTIIGKRFYAVEDPENEDCYLTKIEDETAMRDPQSDPGTNADNAADEPGDEDSGVINIEGETNPDDFEFEDFENGSVIITRYRGEDKEVTIPAELGGKPVRAIGGRAFMNCEDLESVVISEGVEEIYWDAFENCKKLKNIVIPESVTSIAGGAFKNTSWLRKQRAKNPVVIVNGIVIDGKSCKGDIVIPEGVREITSDAFADNGKLTSVVIPEGVTVIGHRAFQVCKQLTGVTLPSTIKTIGEWAFEDCKKLENLNFPEGVEELGDSAFNGTPWLENKRKEAPLVIFGTHLYDGRGCKGDVEIPDGITHICYHAFYYNRELTSVTIPESVTLIDRYAFQGCSALKNVELEWGVKKISEGAFSRCAALKGIKFPWSLTEIGECAFYECESLEEIELPDDLPMIAGGTFYGCSSLDHIYIRDSVTEIGDGAFGNCTSMRWAQLPDDLKIIPNECFKGCTSLEKVEIPNGLEVIKKGAFEGCTALEKISLPDSINDIWEEAFMNCTALKEVYLPEALGVVCYSMFENCTSLEEVHFEDGLRVIGTSAFHNCGKLEELDLPDTLKQINDLAFAGCCSLEEVEIPDSVVRFDPTAFRSCRCTVTYKGKVFSLRELTTSVEALNNEDIIVVDIFGKAAMVRVISTGDNQFDKNGQHKPDGFALSKKEIAVLNDFLENVKLADHIGEITNYCNERYDENAEKPISEDEMPSTVKIHTIAVNVCKDGGEDDPEIALMGDCDCDDEGGICIGFREGKLVGIEQQDWLL